MMRVDWWVDGWTDEWMNWVDMTWGRRYRYYTCHRYIDGVDEWVDGWMNGWTLQGRQGVCHWGMVGWVVG